MLSPVNRAAAQIIQQIARANGKPGVTQSRAFAFYCTLDPVRKQQVRAVAQKIVKAQADRAIRQLII